MPKCYIIMPITTPTAMAEGYHGGADHFVHVLDHLFVPAVKLAEMEPVPPKVQGADVIQGEIIANLQEADLVLCDMSTLNANVFLELGVRTSLNKPVCLVRDEKTPKVPFDASVLNHHPYTSTLDPWLLKTEVPKLAEHIKASVKTCEGKNPLWKYFGLAKVAAPPERATESEMLSVIMTRLDRMESERARQVAPRWPSEVPPREDTGTSFRELVMHDEAVRIVSSWAAQAEVPLDSVSVSDSEIGIGTPVVVPPLAMQTLERELRYAGLSEFRVRFMRSTTRNTVDAPRDRSATRPSGPA